MVIVVSDVGVKAFLCYT